MKIEFKNVAAFKSTLKKACKENFKLKTKEHLSKIYH